MAEEKNLKRRPKNVFHDVIEENEKKLFRAWKAFLSAIEDEKIPEPEVYRKYYEKVSKSIESEKNCENSTLTKQEELFSLMKEASNLVDQTLKKIPHQVIEKLNLSALEKRLKAFQEKIEKIEQELNFVKKQYFIDDLTGLWNRKALKHYFENIVKEKLFEKDFSVLYIDLNGFKAINDTFGHNVGDDFLRRFSQVLKSKLRSTDFLCRLYGDEFVIVLDSANFEQAKKIIQRLIDDKDFYFEIENKEKKKLKIPIKFSIGLTNVIQKDTLKTVLERADSSMYHHKKTRSIKPLRI